MNAKTDHEESLRDDGTAKETPRAQAYRERMQRIASKEELIRFGTPSPTISFSALVDEIVPVLAKVQSSMQGLERNREVEVLSRKGSRYRFAYTTLDAIMERASPLLAENGLVVTWDARYEDQFGYVEVTCYVLHKSGQWCRSTARIPLLEDKSAQAIGSALTYARRYTVSMLLSVTSEEDDDGNIASQSQRFVANDRRDQDRQGMNHEPRQRAMTPEQQEFNRRALELMRRKILTREQITKLLEECSGDYSLAMGRLPEVFDE